ncbi:OmpA family protein [Fulvivirga sp.]|uniref:OmpA family protein n=1 Tax=Fulvivirga sp. TaxID=1931237 RepID=UPI0032EDF0F7
MRLTLFTFSIVVFLNINAFQAEAQLSTKSKKAAELYAEADNFRVRGQYTQAIDLLEQAIAKDKNFHEAYFRLGVIYKAKGEIDIAEKLLLKVIELNPGNNGPSFFELGELYIKKNNYQESIDYINKYLAYDPRNRQRVAEAEKILANAQFAIDNAEEMAEFDPHPLSDTVNAFPMQYFPILSVDQNSLIFTRRLGTSMQHDEDLVVSTKDDEGVWQLPVSISENINSEFNEGTCTLSADGRTLIFTSCYGRQGYGSCDLYISEKTGDEWSVPKNLGPAINSSAWDSQPSLSADGRRLFFISNRSGGVGSRDIWLAYKNENNEWEKPVNLGRGINTVNDEVSPFIHPNNKTLYYATNGLPGFGGFDIYYSNELDGKWEKPENLGPPINNGEDQVSLFITSDGNRGYYSNEDNKSKDRKGIIYEFDVPKSKRVEYRTSFVTGTVKDSITHLPLKAKIELYDIELDRRVSLVNSDSINGKYLMVLTEGSQYALYVERPGYLFQSNTFNYQKGDSSMSIQKDFLLSPIKEGVKTVLNNIFFETDKYELTDKSKTELKKVVDFMSDNPSIKIQIEGHTDNVGSDSYNNELSKRRSLSVYTFLLNNGIVQKRISYQGFGSKKPKVPNDSDQNRQLNRRIEFKIVGLR